MIKYNVATAVNATQCLEKNWPTELEMLGYINKQIKKAQISFELPTLGCSP